MPILPLTGGQNEVDLSATQRDTGSTPAIHITGLEFTYPSPLPGGSPRPALRGIDLYVTPGEFVAIMGPVGAGKSTLCFALNGAIPHAVDGEFRGQVSIYGQDTRQVPMGELAMQVGLVFEDVESQLFNASVADEIAFGLEMMGLAVDEIESRLDESLALMGLASFRERIPRTLSGGEQKRLALASVLAMRPRLLVLDEPTSGLDPRGRRQVLEAIDALRFEHESPMTVVMATQDAEAAAYFADRVIVLDQGHIVCTGAPDQVFARIADLDEWGLDVPQLARLAYLLSRRVGYDRIFFSPEEAYPAVAEALQTGLIHPDRPAPGRTGAGTGQVLAQEPPARPVSTQPLIAIQKLGHRYPETERPALQDVSLDILPGEWLALIGINGSGKTTLLKHLNGLLKPTSGSVHVAGQDTRLRQVGELARVISYLPQNPDHLIFSATVRQEVAYGPQQLGLRGQALEERVDATLAELDLLAYADYPPAVLGYGLRRQVAMASVLAMNAPVLALDEPTVGLDYGTTAQMMDIVARRHQQGTTVIMITHDLQWIARYAQQVAVLEKGRLVAYGSTREVLADIDRLLATGLEPLPVTALAHRLQWPAPLPLFPEEMVTSDV